MTAPLRSGLPGFAPAGFFALRTPLLPFDEFLSWTEGLAAAASVEDPERLQAALVDDRRILRERLRALVARPAVREALFLASPDLFEAIGAWEEQPESDRGRRVERALVKYVSRMCGRATPFGLFAGNGVGRIGTATSLELEKGDRHRRCSRLDADFLDALAETLARDPAVRPSIVYRPNSSLYRSGDRWRYVETLKTGKDRTYRLAGVEDSPPLSDTLSRAEHGATLAELAAHLVDDDVSRSEADAFVAELAGEQLLVPELGPCLTGDAPPGRLMETLRRLPEAAPTAAVLEEVVRDLETLDAEGTTGGSAPYLAIGKKLASLPVPTDLRGLFQVDVVTATRATLGGEVLEEIAWYAALARKLLPPTRAILAEFCEAFSERYGEREVPLVEALDEEAGIGFPAFRGEGVSGEPLLAALPSPGSPQEDPVVWGPRERLLVRKAGEAWTRHETEVVLTDQDVAELSTDTPYPLPGSFAVVGVVAAPSGEALERGDFRLVLTGLDGPSGARLLGRYCHADSELRERVQEYLREEEALDPDAVFAEVVHLPMARAGNVLYRPVLRSWEIPFLGSSGAPPDRQIPVSDLLVSVRDGEIRLRSRRLGRRVVPRITAAHAYFRNSLGLYHFLGELQGQGVAVGCPFGWGPLSEAPFLPRVRYGRLVLSTARWKVRAPETQALARLSGAERYRAVQAWRSRRSLPRFVVFSREELELPIDLEADLSVDAFLHLAKDIDSVDLLEMLPGPDELCAHGPEGRFVHEFVVPFIRTRVASASPTSLGPSSDDSSAEEAVPPASRSANVRRSYLPGSEWLTAKVYCGGATADRLLVGTIAPLVREALASGIARSWFFLRFSDPRPHLRLRVRGDARQLAGEVTPRLCEALDEAHSSGQVWKVQLDTYDREVERYGGPEAIELAEEIFQADSEAVVDLLERLDEGSEGAEERWRLALRGTDMLLGDLGLDGGEKRHLVKTLRKAFAKEHHADTALSRALGARFRPLARELARLLDPGRDAESPLEPGFEVLRARSRRLAPLTGELVRLDRAHRLSEPLPVLAASFAHMFLNRLLRSAQRRQEMVVYDFLGRLYESRAARGSAA